MINRYMIVKDQGVLIAEGTNLVYHGVERIEGKRTEFDRKFVSKVDPTLVTEKMRDGETVTHKPVLVYSETLQRRTNWMDSLTVNGMFMLLGAGIVISLYYWGLVKAFAY